MVVIDCLIGSASMGQYVAEMNRCVIGEKPDRELINRLREICTYLQIRTKKSGGGML